MARGMTDTIDPLNQGGQHNHGPGVFIAGNVYGDVTNHQAAQLGHDRNSFTPTLSTEQHDEADDSDGSQHGEKSQASPGTALLGWMLLTAMLLGMTVYATAAALAGGTPAGGDRVAAAIVGGGSAIGGLIALAFALAALAEVCAAGTANAAASARQRWKQGQRTAAGLNLRYAVTTARVASFSAVGSGIIAGLLGFLAVGRKAADRAHGAHELADIELAQTLSVLGPNFTGK